MREIDRERKADIQSGREIYDWGKGRDIRRDQNFIILDIGIAILDCYLDEKRLNF